MPKRHSDTNDSTDGEYEDPAFESEAHNASEEGPSTSTHRPRRLSTSSSTKSSVKGKSLTRTVSSKDKLGILDRIRRVSESSGHTSGEEAARSLAKSSRPMSPASLFSGLDTPIGTGPYQQQLGVSQQFLFNLIGELFPDKKPACKRMAHNLRRTLGSARNVGDRRKEDNLLLSKMTRKDILELFQEDYLKVPSDYSFTPSEDTLEYRKDKSAILGELRWALTRISKQVLDTMGEELPLILEIICGYSGRITERDARQALLNMYDRETRKDIQQTFDLHPTLSEAFNDLARNHSPDMTINERRISYIKERLDYNDIRPGLRAIKKGVAMTEPELTQPEINQKAIFSALHRLPSNILSDLYKWIELEVERNDGIISYTSFMATVDKLLEKHGHKKKKEDEKTKKVIRNITAETFAHLGDLPSVTEEEKEEATDTTEPVATLAAQVCALIKEQQVQHATHVNQLAQMMIEQSGAAQLALNQISHQALMQRPLASYPSPLDTRGRNDEASKELKRQQYLSRLIHPESPRYINCIRFLAANHPDVKSLYQVVATNMEKRGRGSYSLKRVADPDQIIPYHLSENGKKFNPSTERFDKAVYLEYQPDKFSLTEDIIKKCSEVCYKCFEPSCGANANNCFYATAPSTFSFCFGCRRGFHAEANCGTMF